jgi:hypothetical protein
LGSDTKPSLSASGVRRLVAAAELALVLDDAATFTPVAGRTPERGLEALHRLGAQHDVAAAIRLAVAERVDSALARLDTAASMRVRSTDSALAAALMAELRVAIATCSR